MRTAIRFNRKRFHQCVEGKTACCARWNGNAVVLQTNPIRPFCIIYYTTVAGVQHSSAIVLAETKHPLVLQLT